LLAIATAQDAATLAAAYDFSGAHTVIDVGGGYGRFIATILKANPHLRGVLFERPPVVPGARRVIEAEGLATRCECVGGDFFVAVPNGCDIYLLKWVLLGWDDERARVLLQNCHRAMSGQATLLIVEPLIPPGNARHPAKLLDVNMLVNYGGRARTEVEYGALLAATGFSMIRTIATASPLQYCVIEAKRNPNPSG
jgi:O-methyltransferase domain